jgi:hypothetical protein
MFFIVNIPLYLVVSKKGVIIKYIILGVLDSESTLIFRL